MNSANRIVSTYSKHQITWNISSHISLAAYLQVLFVQAVIYFILLFFFFFFYKVHLLILYPVENEASRTDA